MTTKKEAPSAEVAKSDLTLSDHLRNFTGDESYIDGDIRFTDSGALVIRGHDYPAEQLLDLATFDDALQLVTDRLGAIATADTALGDGFAIAGNKDTLIGVPLLFLVWNFNAGDFGEFVSARCVARGDTGGARKVIVNDGSVGVYKQLREYTKITGKMGGLIARNGLTRSDYPYTDDKGAVKQASTYYIDTSA